MEIMYIIPETDKTQNHLVTVNKSDAKVLEQYNSIRASRGLEPLPLLPEKTKKFIVRASYLPVTGKEVIGKEVIETLYEVHRRFVEDDIITGYSVFPVYIVGKSVFPGCTKESIIAIDHRGREFTGSTRGYHKTEKEAWEFVRNEIEEGIQSQTEQMRKIKLQIETLEKFKRFCMPASNQKGEKNV